MSAASNELLVALRDASESEKAQLADFLLMALDDVLEQDSATKRRIVAAFDRYVDEHGKAR